MLEQRSTGPAVFLRGVARAALQRGADQPVAAASREHDRSEREGRVVTNVLRVPALELRDPVAFVVLSEAGDAALHQQLAERREAAIQAVYVPFVPVLASPAFNAGFRC